MLCYTVKMDFITFKEWFDEEFSILLKNKITTFSSYSKSIEVAEIISYIESIASGGKRFRPYLVYCASGTDNDHKENFLLLASVELLHIFALVHDDIIDEADTRHTVMCAHKKFGDKYGKRTGESIGILLGDIIFAWAYECLFEYTLQFPNSRIRVIEEFTKLVAEVTHGQILDVLSPVQSQISTEAIKEKMILKTARYSFVRPLSLGFILNGDDPNDQEFAEKFGLFVGIGFQLQDDLLDLLPSKDTGKEQFSDIQNGNQTLLSSYVLELKSKYTEEFKLIFGKPINKEDGESILLLLQNSGAINYIESMKQEYFKEAFSTVENSRKNDKDKWNSIINMIEKRKK